MALGRPISLTNNVASKIISVLATSNQTVFTVVGGYRVNQIGVFRNGVRLSNNSDFTALDGSTVTLINPAQINDEVLFEVQDDFRVSDAIVSAASTQTINGNLSITGNVSIGGSITGDISGDIDANSLNISGVATATSFSVPDNGKFIAGTDNDLEIYHDGSNARIKNTTGQLWLQSDNGIRFVDSAINESFARFTDNGAVELYYDGTKKFDTKSDGVDITGELQCDSLDVDGSADISGNVTLSGFVDCIRNASDGFGYLGVGPGGSNEKAIFVNRSGEVDLELYSNYSSSATVSINSDGTASFTNNVTIASSGTFTGSAGILLRADTNQLFINGTADGSSAIDVKGNAIIKGDGSAEFAGTIWGGSVDGGVTATTSYASRLYNNSAFPTIYAKNSGNGGLWQGVNSSGTPTSSINSAGTAVFGPINVSSSTGYGASINLAANAGDVRSQCQETASLFTQLYGAYRGSNLVWSVLANGNSTFTGTVSDSIGPLRRLGVQGASSTFDLAADHAGKFIRMTGSGQTIGVNQNIFTAGDMITIFNVSSGTCTINQASGVTLYNAADGSTGTKTLAAKGLITILCTASNEFIMSGTQLS